MILDYAQVACYFYHSYHDRAAPTARLPLILQHTEVYRYTDTSIRLIL